jgi:flagellar hook-associated protein 3 FlgL
MRITGSRMIDLASAATTKAQGNVADLTAQMSSGMRVQQPSDDPTAWLAAHRAALARSLSSGTGVAIGFSRDRLDQTDAVLASISEAIQSAQTLAVQASSDTYNATNRADLATQVRGLFTSALAAANTQAPNGEYLLAGNQSLAQPFNTTTGAYAGDTGTRAVPTTALATQTVTIPGSALTATGGVDVLPLLDKLATAMAANDTVTIKASLTDFDTAVKQLASLRSHAGSAMNVLDQADQARGQLEENMSKDIAKYVEADTIGTASSLAKASQALDVSRTVASHVIELLSKTAG